MLTEAFFYSQKNKKIPRIVVEGLVCLGKLIIFYYDNDIAHISVTIFCSWFCRYDNHVYQFYQDVHKRSRKVQ